MNIATAMDCGISKTKMMVFARSKTRHRNLPTLKFGNLDLDLVDDYVYLGICFNWNGSFVKAKNSFMIKHRRPCTH